MHVQYVHTLIYFLCIKCTYTYILYVHYISCARTHKHNFSRDRRRRKPEGKVRRQRRQHVMEGTEAAFLTSVSSIISDIEDYHTKHYADL